MNLNLESIKGPERHKSLSLLKGENINYINKGFFDIRSFMHDLFHSEFRNFNKIVYPIRFINKIEGDPICSIKNYVSYKDDLCVSITDEFGYRLKSDKVIYRNLELVNEKLDIHVKCDNKSVVTLLHFYRGDYYAAFYKMAYPVALDPDELIPSQYGIVLTYINHIQFQFSKDLESYKDQKLLRYVQMALDYFNNKNFISYASLLTTSPYSNVDSLVKENNKTISVEQIDISTNVNLIEYALFSELSSEEEHPEVYSLLKLNKNNKIETYILFCKDNVVYKVIKCILSKNFKLPLYLQNNPIFKNEKSIYDVYKILNNNETKNICFKLSY